MNLTCINNVCEVQMNMANVNCVEHDDLCKNESHDKSNHGIFCVTEKDSGLIEMHDLY